ncbi:MAG: tetratricopeptide repeat protein [Betaproteobacteria bacterium]|nr:tetratricopeptide repeat protein [Betaproteobacteria bacterium]MDH4324339.1 tetratricopeptide repeat protein [Betaproteobacteria bacterium]MDH5579359.1 tetratricopeptide repeat protein [Betaproteobacteria bacterium]
MPGTLRLIAALALTLGTGSAFPEPPASRDAALAALEHPVTERRAEAVVWVANHGRMEDADLLVKRLHDESAFVRDYAERGLWLLWSRSGDAQIDHLMGSGVQEMQSGQYARAIATFSEVIRRRPDFAEGWNKRATVRYLAGAYRESMADCDEVLKRNPQHFGALSGYGQIHFQLEAYAEAIAWWRRALQVNPNMLGVELSIKGAEERLREKRGRST